MKPSRGSISTHAHNKSLLYSNRPKFKEDLRDNIYMDNPRTEGLASTPISQQDFNKVMTKIKKNAIKERYKLAYTLLLSTIITIFILIYLKNYLDYRFSLA